MTDTTTTGGRSVRPRRPSPEEEQVARGLARWLATWTLWPDSQQGLRVGVACDGSQPMQDAARHMALLMWAFTTGAKLAGRPRGRDPVAVRTAAVVASTGRGAVTMSELATDEAPPIPEVTCGGGVLLDDAVQTAATAAGLTDADSGTARLLVMITTAYEMDSRFISSAYKRINDLREAGCGVLWLVPVLNDVDFGVFPDVAVQVFETDQPLLADALGAAAADAMRRVDPARSPAHPVPDTQRPPA